MWFHINLCGIEVHFRICDYEPSTEDDWYSQWCNVDFSFRFANYLNYHGESAEVLLSAEVESLETALTQLLRDQVTEISTLSFVEPDFKFILHPKRDKRKDGVICRPGTEIADIYLEWKIYFWDDGLTDNHLTVVLDRDDIRAFRDYLSDIIRPKLK